MNTVYRLVITAVCALLIILLVVGCGFIVEPRPVCRILQTQVSANETTVALVYSQVYCDNTFYTDTVQ